MSISTLGEPNTFQMYLQSLTVGSLNASTINASGQVTSQVPLLVSHSAVTQVATIINTPVPIAFEVLDHNNPGITQPTSSTFVVAKAGFYEVSLSAQVGPTPNTVCYIWALHNGILIDHSTIATRVPVVGNPAQLAISFIHPFLAGETLTFQYATANVLCGLEAIVANGLIPAIASVSMTIMYVSS